MSDLTHTNFDGSVSEEVDQLDQNNPNNGPSPTLQRPPSLSMNAIWSVLEKLYESIQGSKKQDPEEPTKVQLDAPRLKIGLATLGGLITPLLCLAMSALTGAIASRSPYPYYWFAAVTGVVLLCMLAVSTPHIAQAQRLMGWSNWQSWAFAIGLDAAIVASEIVAVFCGSVLGDLHLVPLLVILGAVGYSATLNIFMNLIHAKWSRVLDPRDELKVEKSETQ